MNYLKIQNPGVAPIEAYTVLGVSTARGTDKIGQFGTGSKHGLNVLIRNGLYPVIYCGKDKITFELSSEIMQGKPYQRVCYRLNDGPAEKMGFSTEFGELDWSTVDMALREFISNALDQTSDISGVKIETVDKPEPLDSATAVYIPASHEVHNYIGNLGNWFLHFSETDYQQEIIPNSEGRGPKIYRRGVFVREITSKIPSLFDYNLKDMPIDECRNLDDFKAVSVIGGLIARDKRAWKKVMCQLIVNRECWETKFIPECRLGSSYNDSRKDWAEWWSEFGDIGVASNKITYEHALNKGKRACLVNNGWFSTMVEAGIPDVDKLANPVEKDGGTLIDPSTDLTVQFHKVWEWLKSKELTRNKKKPKLQAFMKPMDGGFVIGGYYENGVVYVNEYGTGNRFKTIIEEIAHHVTGSSDGTRDFQDYAFLVTSMALQELV